MHIVTLMAVMRLDASLAAAIRDAWGGGDAVVLDPLRAIEFTVPDRPSNVWEVWEAAQRAGADLVVQPQSGRRKDVLIADMDSTMIPQECIDELADMAGVGARVKEITAQAMNGELGFEGALRERVGLLRGLPVEVIEKVWRERITLMPGAAELIATMRAHGGYCALVSGGFTQFSARVAEALGFDRHRANRLIERDGVLTGTLGEPILGREAKAATLLEVCDAQGVGPDRAMAVGDGANDLGMIRLAGSGVALHAKPLVAAETDLRINYCDLTALLFLQGYATCDFIRP